jgi:hypothetical protein
MGLPGQLPVHQLLSLHGHRGWHWRPMQGEPPIRVRPPTKLSSPVLKGALIEKTVLRRPVGPDLFERLFDKNARARVAQCQDQAARVALCQDQAVKVRYQGAIPIPIPMITRDTTITSRSIVSHVGMRFSLCWGMACPSAPGILCRKSASGCEYVHTPWGFMGWLTLS